MMPDEVVRHVFYLSGVLGLLRRRGNDETRLGIQGCVQICDAERLD